jgi:hypothetical protein
MLTLFLLSLALWFFTYGAGQLWQLFLPACFDDEPLPVEYRRRYRRYIRKTSLTSFGLAGGYTFAAWLAW